MAKPVAIDAAIDPARIAALPAKPGVYLFRDQAGEVIYVGKAASLRARVRSYFGSHPEFTAKNRALVERIRAVEVIVANGEAEALLLENNMIKRYKPRFNIRLRDDKSFLYIKISVDETYPRVYTTRRVLDDGTRYFGPYANAKSLRRTLKLLNKLFPFRTCALDMDREWDRPCLKYHIDLCNGPCIRAVEADEYRRVIDSTIDFLRGRSAPIVADLEREMKRAAEKQAYETAALARDRLAAISKVMAGQQAVDDRAGDIDAIGVAREGRQGAGYVLNVRTGRIVGHNEFPFALQGQETEAELAGEFVREYYARAVDLPAVVLLATDIAEPELVAASLSARLGRKVVVRVPQRGPRRRLLEMATNNAREALAIEHRSLMGSRRRLRRALDQIGEALGLRRLPRRIECFDISHLQGAHVVGAMVVFEDGMPQKSQYRRFRIKGDWGNDDFASMREVVARRFARLEKQSNGPGGFAKSPDLVIVDGGRGQLRAALKGLEGERAISVPLAALAKREEELYSTNSPRPIRLPPTSEGFYLLQRIRDEAHRFAVGYHVSLRSRSSRRSELDRVPGVGPARRRQLMRHFGSLARLRAASAAQIAEVPGIGSATATAIHQALAE
ncbi:MAG: excinuclease ABC subunit UvrC [Chloroflexi bacterium]|nr:excinuclease ABC subunit UvrC [Chloroflexota bacterium]